MVDAKDVVKAEHRLYQGFGLAVVHGVCAYELVALHSGLPTWTRLAHAHRHLWWGRLAVTTALSWLIFHLFVERSIYVQITIRDGVTGSTAAFGSACPSSILGP